MGNIQPLPPGPRHTWQMDFITGVGPSSGPTYHILTLIDTFSKFCVLTLTKDRKSSTVAQSLSSKLFACFGAPTCIQCDNGTEFKGDVNALCAAHKVTLQRSLPYSSHVQGKVERLHRTLEQLLSRTMTTLPPAHWPILIPELQYTINTTYQRSIGCAPYLIMFGNLPPSQAPFLPPTPTPAQVRTYASAIAHRTTTLASAAAAHHSSYASRESTPLSPDAITTALTPGRFAMVCRPRTNKIFTTNAGPFLVLQVQPPWVRLQSITNGVTIKENVKNVRPLHLPLH